MIRFFILILFSLNAFSFETTGMVSFENRYFKNDNNLATKDQGLALASRLAMVTDLFGMNVKASVKSRIDQLDPTRNISFIEELKLEKTLGKDEDYLFVFGFEKFNWRSTEVFSAVDIINSRNYDGALEDTEKFGELTLGFKKYFENSNLSIFVFPRTIENYIPGGASRLGVGVEIQDSYFINGSSSETDEEQTQYAIKYDQFSGWGDWSLFFTHHYDRQTPIFGNRDYVLDPTRTLCGLEVCPTDGTLNTPYYFEVKDFGGYVTIPWEKWIFKGEYLKREFSDEIVIGTFTGEDSQKDYEQMTAGFEYLYSFDSGHDLRVIGEFSKTLGVDDNYARRRFIFQNDVYLGVQYLLNNSNDTTIDFGAIKDITSGISESIYLFSYESRLKKGWKLGASLRYIDAEKTTDYPQGLEIYEDDHQGQLSLSYYF
tara:strand:+ start:2304 stop:3590 length:1287 start_codon:yes stop_codon:yes gene_type:complete